MPRVLNRPIQVISSCNIAGEFVPIRFRFESPDCELLTVEVEEVLYQDGRTAIHGDTFMHYACRGTIYDRTRTFILCYIIREHRWVLYQFLT